MHDATTEHWRTLEEQRGERPLPGEFPPGVDERPDAIARRTFLKLMGAGAALSGLAGCTGGVADRIVPYANRPPEVTPGIAAHYATSMLLDGYATGLVVESHEGRPTKIEGNPDHPASLGAAGVHEQAWVLGLYDPCRAQTLRRGPDPQSWSTFLRAFGPGSEVKPGLHFLLEPTCSPLLASLIARIRAARPDVGFHFHAPLASNQGFEATLALFGRALSPQLDLSSATTILALDSDFLASGPFHLRHARHFGAGRRPSTGAMSRLYVVEPSPTPTGTAADHRLVRRASEVQRLAGAILAAVVLDEGRKDGIPEVALLALEKLRAVAGDAAFVRACARDLVRHAATSLVVAGERQPAAVHALAALLNSVLGVRAVSWSEPAILDAGAPSHGLAGLVAAIDAKAVDTLVIVGGNPVYTAPADLDLGARVAAIRRTVRLGLYEDETARACQWFVPEAHGLESWGDGRAYDGTVSLVQPLVTSFYGGKTASELLGAFLPGGEKTALEHLRAFWNAKYGDDELAWRRALERGFVPGALPTVDVKPSWDAAKPLLAKTSREASGLEVVFAADPAVHDGRFTNNPWLLELPDPLTKLTWDKAALVSPKTAAALGVATEDLLELRRGERSLRVPVFVLPGHADDAVTLPLGYGREGAESIASGVGVNAYSIRTSDAPVFAGGFSGTKAPGSARSRLATTQAHWSLEGRPIARQATLDEYKKKPTFAKDDGPRPALYEPPRSTGNQWAMTIDLNLCTGCNACVVACQSENNTPVVGKQGVLDGREMHWMRIDRYFKGTPAEPEIALQPMLCQHCEKAPCEYVCPVNATTHSPDGINEQTYNRCVGTRFCSNNCPYKVRRFNWFNYQADTPPIRRLAMNPDVTVRERGVMEKCTFCVQRIRGAEIRAQVEGRPLRDGEIKTACQGACPAQAIVFGSIADPASAVSKSWLDPRRYEVLEDYGTRPRVQYLARVTNPNPELAT
jgi:molybdopterin-containing oxidoreductase family iron-sulfur binding subunit